MCKLVTIGLKSESNKFPRGHQTSWQKEVPSLDFTFTLLRGFVVGLQFRIFLYIHDPEEEFPWTDHNEALRNRFLWT